MNIKPIGNRLVVKLVVQATTSNSGIIVSTKQEKEQSMGEIVAIGTGADVDNEINVSKLGLNIGDIVLFGKYAGEEFNDPKNSDITYKILKVSEVMATVN